MMFGPYPSHYVSRQLLPIRDRWVGYYAKARQDNAIVEGRKPNIVGNEYDKDVFTNKIGLCGETVLDLWVWDIRPGQMQVVWHVFKKGDIWYLADIECGDQRPRPHTELEAKANHDAFRTNYLIVDFPDLPNDRSRDHRIFVHTFPASFKAIDRKRWAFECPLMVMTGWCFGWEIRQVGPSKPDDLTVPVPGIYNIPEHHPIMKPMRELRRLIWLRERYGAADGELKWERGEQI